jgi:deoxyribodipyrimidine photo-lyase
LLVNKKRIHQVNQAEVKRNSYVAYWMQSAQRLEYNQALGFAIEKANQLKQPLLIFFLVDLDYPEAEFGHFEFMFTGLKELQKKLKQADFNFYILSYHKPEQLKKILDDASLLVSEKSYLKNLQSWKKSIADLLTVPFYLIETNLICPIGEVSSKEEYAAYTIRKKINAVKAEFLQKYQLPELLNKTKVKTTAKRT